MLGQRYPAVPMFGITPCPLTIFTCGLLLLARRGVPAMGAAWAEVSMPYKCHPGAAGASFIQPRARVTWIIRFNWTRWWLYCWIRPCNSQ